MLWRTERSGAWHTTRDVFLQTNCRHERNKVTIGHLFNPNLFMQTLPAGIALFLAEICFGLTLAGIHHFAPHDKCTRYWAIAMLLTGVGVLIVTENAGNLNYAKLALGNCGIIFGGVCYWWGIQLFYHRRRSRSGWLIGGAFALLYGLMLAAGASIAQRSLLASCFTLLIAGLYLREIIDGHRGRHAFGSLLALTGIGVLTAVYGLRVILLLSGIGGNVGQDSGSVDVVIVFLVPLVGLLLFGAGLMLMYFERVIAENHRLASEDALTGLLNRRAIVAAGERAVAHARRHREPLTVAILDIDFFKRINDSFGHDGGDEVLVGIAALLNAQCRQEDLVGRYGGEEFCILFPAMDEAASASAAQRILQAVRSYRHRQTDQLSISVGMVVLRPEQATAANWAALIKTADQQLYLAKQEGRDQCRRTLFTADGAQHPLDPRPVAAVD